MAQCMLTTTDNPYDPFTQFEEWYNFDIQKGYFTCAYLDRVSFTSPNLSDADYELAIETAIDDICRLDILGKYKKVTLDTVKQE